MKLFKAARAFKLVSTIDNLDLLVDHPPKELAWGQSVNFGWINAASPLLDMPACEVNEHITMLCLVKTEKYLPSASVNLEVKKRIAKITDRKVGRKEREQIKDDVIVDNLPNAMPKESRTYAYIDTKNNLLVIDQASDSRCDEFTDALRNAIGSLPVVPVTVGGSPNATMGDWVANGSNPNDLELTGSAKFVSKFEDGETATVKNVDWDSDCISGIIEDGMIPKELALRHYSSDDQYIDFTVTDGVAIKSIKFSHGLMDDAYSDGELDALALALINCETITRSLNSLFELFGGIAD